MLDQKQLGEKLALLERLEVVSAVTALVFFLSAALIFWRWRVFHSIGYLSGWKKRRELRKLRKRNRTVSCILAVLTGCLMLSLLAGDGEVVSARRKKEAAGTICLKAMESGVKREGIFWYNEGVYGSVPLPEDYGGAGKIEIRAIPLDEVAEKSVKDSPDKGQDGTIRISGWSEWEAADGKEFRFSFRKQGKWKLYARMESVLYEDAGEEEEDSMPSDTEEEQEKEEKKKREEQEEKEGAEQEENQIVSVHEAYSEAFILDLEAPVLEVRYVGYENIGAMASTPENVNRSLERGQKRITASENEVFLADGGQIVFEMREDYFAPGDGKLRVYETDYGTGKTSEITKEMPEELSWQKKEGVYLLSWVPEREGHFRFCLEYTDGVGHEMTAKEESETESCMKNGRYESPLCTVDRTKPAMKEFIYTKEPERMEGKRCYYTKEAEIIIEIEEENFNREDFVWEDMSAGADGILCGSILDENVYSPVWTSNYEDGKRINRATVTVREQGNHFLTGETVDGAGMKSEPVQGECTLDETAPDITVQVETCDFYVPYMDGQYFGRDKLRLVITATDEVSGVRAIQYNDVDMEGRQGEICHGIRVNDKKDVRKDNLSQYTAEVIIDKKDFRGQIFAKAEDLAGHQSQWISSPLVVVETAGMRGENSGITWTLPRPFFTDEKKKIKYYNRDIEIKTGIREEHSGLREGMLCVDSEAPHDTEEMKDALKKMVNYIRRKTITYEDTWSLSVPAGSYPWSSETYPLQIEAVWQNNCGYESRKKYREYKVVLDAKKPEITVRYNCYPTGEESCLRQTRVATVTVKDSNFKEASVRWLITGANKKYHIGKWTGSGELHRCRVRFPSDGEGYKIKLAAADYAGNRSVWDKDTPFTIDKTPPVLELHMDEKGVKNGNYYNTAREIRFRVEDKNVNPAAGAFYMDKKGDKIPLKLNKIAEGVYETRKKFAEDGSYSIQFVCVDLAGNRTECLTKPEFIIDGTRPKLTVRGVQPNRAYGGSFRPEIEISDEYLDKKAVKVRLTRADGGKIFYGKKKCSAVEGALTQDKNKMCFRWEELPRGRRNDGLYVLKVKGRDKAGNPVAGKEEIPFIVNRHGALFALEDSLREPMQNGHLREGKTILLRERSVQRTDTRITIIKDNQKVIKSQPAVVRRERILEEKGRTGWREKEIRISKENFQEEGVYRIMVESSGFEIRNGRKETTVRTNNDKNQLPLCFTVDKTPPMVKLGGLEDKFYKTKAQKAVLTVMDNYALEEVTLIIRYEGNRKKAKELHFLPKSFEENHSTAILLEAYNGKQTISWRAKDRAGNVRDSENTGESITCVITDNGAVQTYYKAPGVIRLALAVAIMAAAGIFGSWKKYRKRKNKIPKEDGENGKPADSL